MCAARHAATARGSGGPEVQVSWASEAKWTGLLTTVYTRMPSSAENRRASVRQFCLDPLLVSKDEDNDKVDVSFHSQQPMAHNQVLAWTVVLPRLNDIERELDGGRGRGGRAPCRAGEGGRNRCSRDAHTAASLPWHCYTSQRARRARRAHDSATG
jgi:hypothetical protein